jgi:long-subunit fatty acid transport protein
MAQTVQRLIIPGCFFISAAVFCLSARPVYAVFSEQMAIDAKAVSLANTCTADPPGLMSAHYNPAGLALLDEGYTFSNGFGLPYIKRTGKFTPDPDFEGFMNGYWGNDPSKYPAYYNAETDPQSNHGGPDPLNNTTGTNSSGRMYIPFYKPINFIFASNIGLASKKKDSNLTFAFANYAPYGGGMNNGGSDNPYRFGGSSFYVQHLIYAAPSVGVSVSDTLSFGASVGMGQRAMGTSMDIRSPNVMTALTRVIGDATQSLEIPVLSEQTLPPPWMGGGLGPYEHYASMIINARDDYVPSFNLGVLWRPSSRFSYGLCYQSDSSAELTGKYTLQYSKQFQRVVKWNGSTPMTLQTAGMLDLPINPVPYQTGTVTGTQVFPQRIQTGIMVRPLDRLKLLVDLSWADWASAGKEDRFHFDQRIQLFRIAKMLGYTYDAYTYVITRDMKDEWHLSYGLEYELNDCLSLRLGYERRPTSLQSDRFDGLYFIPDADLFGAGLGIKLPDGSKVDIGFGWLTSTHFKVLDNTSTNLNSLDFTYLNNPYAGLDYEQDVNIYIASIGLTMPLDVQLEMFRKQEEFMKRGIRRLKSFINKLNPFERGGETKTDNNNSVGPDSKETNDGKDENFNRYLDLLSAEQE